ncbi:MAG TPA: UbiA family prenyltransferase [Trueperaceae bacterium]
MKRIPISGRVLLAHPWLRHLRLPFNLLLSPIYFWGAFLAGGSLRQLGFWLGYVSLHVFLYGGTTAFNSYYDKDTGPVGGMLQPPPVDRGLLAFSLAFQALGLPLALAVRPGFGLAWLLLFLVFAAYSHPAVRLKASPGAAMLAIALGQGAVGFAAGWLAIRPFPLLPPRALLGMLATALVVSGLYIVTQSYQTGEDRARGDRTLPVVLGPQRALAWALVMLAAGGLAMLVTAVGRLGPVWVGTLAVFFVVVGGLLARWAAAFDEAQVERNFRIAMRLSGASSAFLSLCLLVQLW